MSNRSQRMWLVVVFCITTATVATIVHAIPNPGLIYTDRNPVSDSSHNANTDWSYSQKQGKFPHSGISTWSGPYSSGQVIITPDGGTTTTWSGPYSSGQVVVKPGSRTTTWKAPYSSGYVDGSEPVVSPR